MDHKNRTFYLIIICIVVRLGLASRRDASKLPTFFAEYAGDTLWALMVFLGVGVLAPRWSSFRAAAVALAVCYAVEISQLYHAPWIDSIRATRVGGLALGFGFLWSDVACYTAGVALGLVLEIAARKVTERRRRALSIP